MKPTVYTLALSPFAHRVKITARAKGCYDQIEFTPRPEGDAYLEITPVGKVPAMVVDGELISESLSICWFVDEAYDGPSLRGSDPLGVARVSMLIRLFEFGAAMGLGKLFQLGPQGDADAVAAAFAELNKGMGQLEHFIGENGFAYGDGFTMADVVLAPTLHFVPVICGMHGRTPFEGAPKCAAYSQSIAQHEYVAPSIAEMTQAMQAMMANG